MSGSNPGKADQVLAKRASEIAGFGITGTQVARWREQGLLPKMIKEGRPRGDPAFPEGTEEHAAALARALRSRRNVNDCILICFAQGFAPRSGVLQKAYRETYDSLWSFLKSGARSSDPSKITQVWTRKLSRRASRSELTSELRDRLVQSKSGVALSDVLGNVLAVVTGADNARVHPDSIAAFGGEGIYRDTIAGQGPALTRKQLTDTPPFSIRALGDAVQASSEEELAVARDDALLFRQFATSFADATRRSVGMDFGFGLFAVFSADDWGLAAVLVPALRLTRQDPENEVDELLNTMREHLPVFEATQMLLDSLPARLQPLVGASAAELILRPEGEVQDFQRLVRKWAKSHPRESETILEGGQERQ